MLSLIEARQILEEGFLPLSCKCKAAGKGALVVTVTDPSTGEVELCVTGVSTAALTTVRAVSDLIAELRAELEISHGVISTSPAWTNSR